MIISKKNKEYNLTLDKIRDQIHRSQYKAFQAVNRAIINLYWEIGKIIVKKQNELEWGDSVIEEISKDLQAEFPGIRGFSARNLHRMKLFYTSYFNSNISSTIISKVGWTHHCVILQKCKDNNERRFYLNMVIKKGWSKRVLERKIERKEFERWAIKQDNFETVLSESDARKGEVMLKDEYNLDFLLIEEEHTERELEDAIVNNIVKFLSEMGGDFAFIGRQFKLEVEEHEYFIDLLFYHRTLKSLIAVELKTDEFKPEYAGKMGMYLSALDEYEKLPEENPSIGIIICRSKNRKIVNLSLQFVTKPVGVATYKTYETTEDLPKNISKYLPHEDEIIKRLEYLERV